MLDDCLFVPNTAAGVIAHNLNDAKAFFRDKIKFAYDNLPLSFRESLDGLIGAEQDASDSLRFNNGSSIRVGTSLRSGTLQRLHVSEYGKLCAKFPEKAQEVKSGAFNTVQAGQSITVESTAEGMSGHFFELCQAAQAHEDGVGHLTELDFKFHFAPWWTTEEYRIDSDGVLISTEDEKYFASLESEGIVLDAMQKAWYVKKLAQQGDDMKREYPSTPKEAFEASVEGAYFAPQMEKMRKEGRICRIPILDQPVYTSWDLGYNDAMAIVFWQFVGMERRIIDYYESSGEGFGHYAKVLSEKGYIYARHGMPHDADAHMLTKTATTRRQEAEDCGIRPIDVVKRIPDEMAGIDASRSYLPQVFIDETRCQRLIACLVNYRKDWDEKLGTWKSKARHDEFAHGYKAFETQAVAPQQGLPKPFAFKPLEMA
jgi:hypothetical protein